MTPSPTVNGMGVRETLAYGEVLRLLGDGRSWTKVALQHAADASETLIDKAVRRLRAEGRCCRTTERCECCGHLVVRYYKVPPLPVVSRDGREDRKA